MKELLIYIFKVNVVFAALYLLYLILFKRLTFFTANRIYLLLMPIGALIAPLITFPGLSKGLFIYTILPNSVIAGNAAVSAPEYYPDWLTAGIMIYFTGIMLALFRFILALIRISSLIRKAGKRKLGAFTILDPMKDHPTFSFFHYVHFNEKENRPDRLGMMEMHEFVHMRQLHSADNLYYELFKSFCWFNPLAYAAHNEIRNIHEYLADKEVVVNLRNSREYSTALLDRSSGMHVMKLATTFYQNTNLKSRIHMMNRKKSRGILKLGYLMIAPLLVFTILLNSGGAVASSPMTDYAGKIDTTYEMVEVLPQFPGGNEAMIKYLQKNLKYPKESKKNGVQGTVYVEFIINEFGKITNAVVKKSVDAALDDAALKVIQEMPDWSPGSQKGKNVKVTMVLPIRFSL